MLTQELKSADAFQLVDAAPSRPEGPEAAALERARARVEEAKAHRAKRKFRLADEALTQAIADYHQAAAALSDVGELVDAFALAAAVQYNTGRDDEGQRSLDQALTLAPTRPLPLAATSPLFAKLVERRRTLLQEGPKGSLRLESSPSNVPVMVDGLPLGATPLVVKDVPPGLHVWRVQLPTGEALGGLIEVRAGSQATVRATSASKEPAARLLAALASNALTADAVAAAKEHAKAAGVELLMFGALSREGKDLALDAFLLGTATGALRRLPRSRFDSELLSAGMEFYRLAGELAKQGEALGEAMKVPASVAVALAPASTKPSETTYGAGPGQSAAETTTSTPSPPPSDGQRVPLAPKRRVPLIKK
jgi:tetratricopeptide (TPR) repeat protein